MKKFLKLPNPHTILSYYAPSKSKNVQSLKVFFIFKLNFWFYPLQVEKLEKIEVLQIVLTILPKHQVEVSRSFCKFGNEDIIKAPKFDIDFELLRIVNIEKSTIPR